MPTINWNDAYWVLLAAIFSIIFIVNSKRYPKDRVAYGIILIVIGAFELFVIAAGYRFAYSLRNNPNYHPDYYGQTVFLPLIIVIAIASIAYGTWLLSIKSKTIQKLKP